MVRQYQAKQNAIRHYGSSASSSLLGAVTAHRSGLSLRKCAEKFKVKRSTLSDKILEKHMKPFGRPTALSAEVEEILAGVLDKLADWNFPVGPFELKIMVKDLI